MRSARCQCRLRMLPIVSASQPGRPSSRTPCPRRLRSAGWSVCGGREFTPCAIRRSARIVPMRGPPCFDFLVRPARRRRKFNPRWLLLRLCARRFNLHPARHRHPSGRPLLSKSRHPVRDRSPGRCRRASGRLRLRRSGSSPSRPCALSHGSRRWLGSLGVAPSAPC